MVSLDRSLYLSCVYHWCFKKVKKNILSPHSQEWIKKSHPWSILVQSTCFCIFKQPWDDSAEKFHRARKQCYDSSLLFSCITDLKNKKYWFFFYHVSLESGLFFNCLVLILFFPFAFFLGLFNTIPWPLCIFSWLKEIFFKNMWHFKNCCAL